MREEDVARTVPARLAIQVEFVHERELRFTVARRLLLYLGILYVVIAWALNTVLAKQAVAEIDPLAFTFMRFLVMSPLAFLFVRMAGGRIRVRRGDWPALVLCAACGFGLYQYFWVIGLKYTTPFASSLLSAMSPIFTLAIVVAFKHERVRRSRWIGAAIALFGGAVFEGAFSGALAARVGDILTFASALVFAGYNVTSARRLNRYSVLELLAITMGIGTLMIAPGGIVALAHTNLFAVSWDVWWRLIFATIFPVLLTYPVWTRAIGILGAGRVSMFSFLTPVLTGLLSVPILHAAFPGYELVGAAICLCGMLVASIKGTQPSTQ